MTTVITGRRRVTKEVHEQEKSPCEDTARRQPSASKGERSQEKPNIPTPCYWIASRNVTNNFLLFKPSSLWYSVMATPVD